MVRERKGGREREGKKVREGEGREGKGERKRGEGSKSKLPKEAFLGLLLNSTTSSAIVCFILEYSISGLSEERRKSERLDK